MHSNIPSIIPEIANTTKEKKRISFIEETIKPKLIKNKTSGHSISMMYLFPSTSSSLCNTTYKETNRSNKLVKNKIQDLKSKVIHNKMMSLLPISVREQRIINEVRSILNKNN